MMGDRCLRSITAKLRVAWVDQALGVRLVPGVTVLVVPVLDIVVKGTRFFIVFIASDAGTVVIVIFSRTIDAEGRDWQ